jgi:hypothetical protein
MEGIKIRDYYLIDNPIGQMIIFTISALFVIALFNLLVYLWRYGVTERQALSRLTGNMDNLDKHSRLSEKKEALLTGITLRSLASERINAIFSIIEKNHIVDQEQLATNTFEKVKSKFGLILITYISRTLVLLGLLGTFIGLSTISLEFKTLLGLVDTSTVARLVDSMQDTARDLGRVTEGITTAFTSTLWGLVGTLLLASGTVFLQHLQQDFLARLEDVTAVKILPIFNPPHITQAIRESNHQLAESTAAIQQTIEGLKQSANETYASAEKMELATQKLDATADTFTAGATMMSESNVEFSQTLGDLSGSVVASTNRDQKLFSNLNKIIKQAQEQQQLMENMLQLMQSSEINIDKVVQSCLKEISARQKKSLEEVYRSRMEYQKIIEKSITNQNQLFDLMITNTKSQKNDVIEAVRELNDEQLRLVKQIHSTTISGNGQLNDVIDQQKQIIDALRRDHFAGKPLLRPGGRYAGFQHQADLSMWGRIKLTFANIFRN